MWPHETASRAFSACAPIIQTRDGAPTSFAKSPIGGRSRSHRNDRHHPSLPAIARKAGAVGNKVIRAAMRRAQNAVNERDMLAVFLCSRDTSLEWDKVDSNYRNAFRDDAEAILQWLQMRGWRLVRAKKP